MVGATLPLIFNTSVWVMPPAATREMGNASAPRAARSSAGLRAGSAPLCGRSARSFSAAVRGASFLKNTNQIKVPTPITTRVNPVISKIFFVFSLMVNGYSRKNTYPEFENYECRMHLYADDHSNNDEEQASNPEYGPEKHF